MGQPEQYGTVRPVVRVVVTGFGGFPGARHNPTGALVRALAKHRPRLARLGIELSLEILPVVRAEIGRRLEALAGTHRPDAILHFGLAARRKVISIETRAQNRRSLLHPDATGATATRLSVLPAAALSARSTVPAIEIATALDRAGIPCRLSRNAGTYICNETLYLSLVRGGAPRVGFIHVPRPTEPGRPRTKMHRRPTLEDLTRAAIIAILVTARKHRCGGSRPRRSNESGPSPAAASLDRIPSLA